MKFTIEQSALKSALDQCRAVAQNRGTLPILGFVRITAAKSGVTLDATNLREELRVTVEASAVTAGSTCVEAASFFNRVSAMPEVAVTVTLKDSKVVIGCKGASRRFTLDTMPPEDFPSMHEPDKSSSVAVPSRVVSRMIRSVLFAVSPDEQRAQLNAAQLSHEGGNLMMAATNGHALSVVGVAHDSEVSETLIPMRALTSLRNICDQDDRDLQVSSGSGRMFVTDKHTRLCIVPAEGKFPPVRQVIPESTDHTITFGRSVMADALKALTVAAGEHNGLLVELSDGRLMLDAGEGAGTDSLDVETSSASAAFKFGIDIRYLVSALASLDSETVEMGASGELEPVVIRPVNGTDAERVIIIMPKRL